MKNLKLSIVALIMLFTAGQINTSFAEVKPAKIFSSNMVLQQGIENKVWGWADKTKRLPSQSMGRK